MKKFKSSDLEGWVWLTKFGPSFNLELCISHVEYISLHNYINLITL
jgi:hypothetical protein